MANPNGKPGQSGNPGGRPNIPDEVKKLLAEGADKAIRFWLDTLGNEEANMTHRLTAAEKLAAYGFGKPKEIIDMDIDGKVTGITIEVVRKLDADD